MKVLIKPILAFTISVFMFSVSPGIAQSSQNSAQYSSELQGVQEEIIASPANTNTYTLAEVALNNSRTSCWTIVSGNVYNITSYIATHPGGVAAISQLCGKDGTSIFSGQHQGDPAPASRLANLKIGTFVPNATSCVEGSYLSAQIQKCVLAPEGFFISGASATSGQTFANPCPIGSYTDVKGSGSCKLSPIGFYVDKEAQSSASACPVGKTTESSGSDSIDDCINADLQAPVATSVQVVGVTQNSVMLSWEKLELARYGLVEYTATLTPSGSQCSTTESSCSITGLRIGTRYVVTLSATNSLGTARSETDASFTPWFASTPPNSKCAASTLDTTSLLVSSRPQISGTSKPGLTLTASTGAWPTGTKTCLFWMRNQEVISGQIKTTYKVQPTDIGRELSFVVVGTDKAGKSSARLSDVKLVSKLTFDKANQPIIVGAAKVGSKLTVKFASWQSGVTYSYQWNIRGVAKSGASSSSFYPKAEDFGENLSVTLCASKDLYEEKCLTSSEVTVGAGTLSVPSTITLTGTAKVGYIISVKPISLPTSSLVSYEWRRDGIAIPNSDGPTYAVTALDRGKKISLRLTMITRGYIDVVRVSAEKKIP